jgi:ribosomal protein S18 acetylase RimI-like enzyme
MGRPVRHPVEVTLRPLVGDELDRAFARSRGGYREQLVEFAGLSEETAARKVEADFTAEAPPGQFHAVERDDGTAVGLIRFAERDYLGEPHVFLYDLWIEPAERGRGYGKAAMVELELEAARRGASTIDFNVWGVNDVARALYRSLGYTERAVFMAKEIPC